MFNPKHYENSKSGGVARHILLITDAQVSDFGRILRLVEEEAKRPDRRRISVLCIDAAPNSFLVLELAERGGGVAKFLTSKPEEEDISTTLEEILEEWSDLVYVGLMLEVDWVGVEAAGKRVISEGKDSALIDVGDLPAGRSLWVAGRIPQGGGKRLNFRLLAGGGVEKAVRYVDVDETQNTPALKALFGVRRILGLEYLVNARYDEGEFRSRLARLGYDPEKVLAGGLPQRVYSENVYEDAKKALKSLLVKEALEYGVACSEVGFIAVRKEAGKVIEGSVPVASALPSGWSEEFLSGGIRRARVSHYAIPQNVKYESSMEECCMRAVGRLEEKAKMTAGGGGVMRELSLDARPPVVKPEAVVVFSGIPVFKDSESVLFDSSRQADARKLPEEAAIKGIELYFPEGALPAGKIDPQLVLLTFVEDLSTPTAKARIADIIRQGGGRPLNIRRKKGQIIKIALRDPAKIWAANPPKIEVKLMC